MNRVEAIKDIYTRHVGSFFVLSNGLTAREAAHFIDQPNSFYLLHGMGESLAVAIGLASSQPQLSVVLIEGDGNTLMGMAAWSMTPPSNLTYYVLANGIFETTGGQPLPALPCLPPWCMVVPIEPGKAETPNPPSPTDIWHTSQAWLRQHGFVKGE